MKKILTLLLILSVLIPMTVRAEETAELPARYTAITTKEVSLSVRAGGGGTVRKVRYDATVEVLEYDSSWCHVRYRGKTGYVRTKYLWGFVSMDPANYPSPQFKPCTGLIVLDQDTPVKGGKFSGVTVGAGCAIAAYDEAFTLPVWRGTAALTAEAGRWQPFISWESAGSGDIIGGFTTYYNQKTGSPLQKPRQHNIALGCSRINGQTVQPGDTFSFNALCAPYKLSNGYQVAKNISHDGKGPGGGICQVSTTLYNAALGLPLRITAWAAHRPSGVNYIPRSFDAAVGSTTDLAFENTLPYAIVIRAMPQDGALTVLISRQ